VHSKLSDDPTGLRRLAECKQRKSVAGASQITIIHELLGKELAGYPSPDCNI
jgi:hypothetical protein